VKHATRLAVSSLICMIVAALPAFARLPREIALTYNVTRSGVPVAVVQERFEASDQAFSITSESSAVGLLALVQRRPARVTSTGRITERGLRPERFEGARGADDPRRVAANFDWSQSRLTIMHEGREETVQLPPGTQDRLSVMYQFMFIDLERLTNLEFAMTNGRKLDRYHYAVTPGVEIDTPLGPMTTVHLARQREPGATQTEVWLSPAHANLPVKVRVVENDGARYEQSITHLDVRR
jgi:uncharacterized protein DUF3108